MAFKHKKILVTLLISLYTLSLLVMGSTAFGAETIKASCQDSIAGYSTLCKTSVTAPNTEVSFKITKPDGSVTRFPCTTSIEGVAKCDLNYYHTKQAGSYQVGAYLSGYNEPADLDQSTFRIFPDTISPVGSSFSAAKLTVAANGSDFSYMTVILKDQYGNGVKDHTVDVISSRVEDRIETIGTNVSNQDGKVNLKVSSKASGVSTFIAKDTLSGITLLDRPKVSFYQANVSTSNSSASSARSSSSYLKADLFGSSNAVGGPAASFKITAPDKVQTNAPFDVTVQVLDSSGSPALSYRGTIFFSSPTDSNAELPLPNEGYPFKGTDENASHLFAKAVTFKSPGTQRLVVTDVDNPDLEAEKFITVTSRVDTNENTNASSGAIAITSPEDGTTYGSGSIDIIGKISPLTTFKVFDGEVEITTQAEQSDADGSFTFTAKGLSDGKHTFKVAAFDSSDVKTGESSEVIVFVDTKSAVLQSITFSPDSNIAANSPIQVTLTSEPRLTKVRVIVDGVAHDLTEDAATPGSYTGSFNAPSKEGEYEVKASLTNSFGKESTPATNKKLVVTKAAATSLKIMNLRAQPGDTTGSIKLAWDTPADTSLLKGYTIVYDTNPITLSKKATSDSLSPTYTLENLDTGKTYYVAVAALDKSDTEGPQSDIIPATPKAGSTKIENLKAVGEDGKISFTWDDPGNSAIVKYKFQYGLRSGEYLENALTKDKTTNWYIPDLINGVSYYFKLEGLDANNQVVLSSDEVSSIAGGSGFHQASAACSATDVSNLKIVTRGDQRILTWDGVANVSTYRIYSGTQEGIFNLPTRDVKDPFFVLPFLSKEVPNYYFAVKALCNDGQTLHESANFSNVLKVKSGPEAFFIAVISFALVLMLYRYLRKKRKLSF